jgi:hypothetical protein
MGTSVTRPNVACETFHKPVLSAPVTDLEERPEQAMGEGYSLVAVGITFALTVTGAALAGVWLDRRLSTLPLFTVVLTLAGMGLGGFWLWARLRRSELRK